ncbi:5011_t:CDS:1, partial [Paraglomus brasilianum]
MSSCCLTKDAITAFETAFNFLQQGNMEIDYNELKVFRSLKKK